MSTSAHLYRDKITFKGEDNTIEIGENSDFHQSTLLIRGNNNRIIIGKNCYLNGLNVNFQGDNNQIIIGDGSFIYDNTRIFVIEGSKFIMEKGCMFSDRIEIRTSDHHSILDMDTDKRLNYKKDIIIHKHVWVGTGVTILKGTEIAEGCIVGAASVVTGKHTTPNSVIVGNPAKEVKQNVKWIMECI